ADLAAHHAAAGGFGMGHVQALDGIGRFASVFTYLVTQRCNRFTAALGLAKCRSQLFESFKGHAHSYLAFTATHRQPGQAHQRMRETWCRPIIGSTPANGAPTSHGLIPSAQ